MKRFKFRLQSVLEQRERLETHAKSSYAAAQQAVQNAEVLLAELTEVRAALLNEVAEQRKSDTFDPLEARLYQDYLKQIITCIRDQEAYVRELQINAEAMRLNLVGASTNRKVVDKIKERDQSAHREQAIRAEQATVDELVSMRHGRHGLRPAQP
jgi:flagellar FliJ protein